MSWPSTSIWRRRRETAAIVAAEGGRCTARRPDVTRGDEVADAVAHCIDIHGRIDVLHNNVGIAEVGGPITASEESWDRVNAVNLKSMFLTCKHVLPHMVARGAGTIVNVRLDRRHSLDGRALHLLQRDQGGPSSPSAVRWRSNMRATASAATASCPGSWIRRWSSTRCAISTPTATLRA